MAQSMTCDLCGEESAVMLNTDLQTGNSMAIGQACLVTFTLTLAVSFSEGAEAEEQATYSDLVAALVGNLAPSLLQLAKSTQPRAPRRSKAAGASHTAQEGASGVDGDASVAGDAQAVTDALSAAADS